ncbi:RND family transporter [Candidatus Margulisiibacteriota bacterium]
MLDWLGNFVTKRYKLIIVLSIVLTILSIIGITKLKMQTEMMDMLPQDEPEVTVYDHAVKNFVGMDSIVVVIEGGNQDEIIRFIEDHAKKAGKAHGIERVIYRSEIEYLEKNGLLLVEAEDLGSIKGMLTASSLKDFIKGLNNNFEKEYTGSGDSEKLSKDKTEVLQTLSTINAFVGLLGSKKAAPKKIIENSNEFVRGPEYMISHDGTMGLFLLRTSLDLADMDGILRMVDELEGILKEKEKDYGVKTTLTGMHIIQKDELRTMERDMPLTGAVSLILVLAIFLFGFGMLRYTGLAAIPLIVGIIWALGIAYLIYGNLNLFTAMMGAILIGLGVDYAIHVMSIYTEMRNKGEDITASVKLIFQKTGRGVITGAMTTAIGFLMFAVSSFKAFREFGITLGFGILMTMIASIVLLPALLMIFGKAKVGTKDRIGGAIARVEHIVVEHAWTTIIVITVVFVVSLFGIPNVKMSKNMLEVEAKGLESIEVNKRLIDKFDFTSDSSIVISKTLQDAIDLKKATDDLSTIGIVDTIAQYVPDRNDQRESMRKIQEIKGALSGSVDKSIHEKELKYEMERLEDNLIEISDLAYIGGEKQLVKKIDGIVNSKMIPNTAGNIEKNRNNILYVQGIFIGNIQDKMRNVNSSTMIGLNDVPKNISDNYIGKDGTFMNVVYPKGDIWQMDYFNLHLAQLRSLDWPSTGTVPVFEKLVTIAGIEGRNVLIYTVIVIFIVLLIDFRSFKYAFLAMLPMGMTLALCLGIMGWLRINFNFVNIMALPLIIGIGVDDGVHIIHRYLIEKRVEPAVRSTGRAITLTTLTTCAAFGSFLLASYRGFISFAFLLVMGIALAYIVTLFLVPSLINVMNHGNNNNKGK